jgi:hypothetical protein
VTGDGHLLKTFQPPVASMAHAKSQFKITILPYFLAEQDGPHAKSSGLGVRQLAAAFFKRACSQPHLPKHPVLCAASKLSRDAGKSGSPPRRAALQTWLLDKQT